MYRGKDENKEDGWKKGLKEIKIEGNTVGMKSCKERREEI